ncbi:uncharacterized protein LOC124631206 [Helicoverpa zea]|uniref:uncharacterized protein LOC124631206 n=1 Tax=Helicoverpa zea TaxID=7113 RepID=UPI001F58B1B9|nr:uncharacterized protein LOC124631206 [Helicoverpa zea]
MKLHLVLAVSLMLIASSNGGLIDGLLGTVKDTTSSITHGIGGVVRSGKNFVFGGTETTAEGRTVTKPGIVGTISMKIHDVSHAVREEVRSVLFMFDGDQEQGQRGVIGRLYDRMTGRIYRVKGFLFGDSSKPNENVTYPPFKKLEGDTTVLTDRLKKHFFKNNTNSSGIQKTLVTLHDAIYRIRHNMTRNNQGSNHININKMDDEEDGVGLLDVRASMTDMGAGARTDFVNGVDAAYDKVNDNFNAGRQKAKSSVADAKQNSQNFIENQKKNLQNNYKNLENDAKKFKSDVDNSLDGLGTKVNEESDSIKKLLENGYSQVNFGAH